MAGALQQRLLVDSGNATMIIGNGEDLVGVAGYTVLGKATEPWGCPANVVKGPVQIAADGGIYQIRDCYSTPVSAPTSAECGRGISDVGGPSFTGDRRHENGLAGNVASPIAMIDTGGGPVFLSDPNGYVYDKK